MENFDELRVLIREKIYSNNNSEITGSILQNILIAITNSADSGISGLISRVSDIEELINGEISGEVNLLNYYTKDETNSLLLEYATKTWVESQGYGKPEDFRYIATEEAEREANKVYDDLSDFAEGITKEIGAITDEIDSIKESINSIVIPDDYIKDNSTINSLAMTTLQVGGYTLTADTDGFLTSGSLKVSGTITAIGIEGVSSQVATHEDLGKYATTSFVEGKGYATTSWVEEKGYITREDSKLIAIEEAEKAANDVYEDFESFATDISDVIDGITDEIDSIKESINSIVIPDLSGYIKDGDSINSLKVTTLQVGNYALETDDKGFTINQGELKVNGKITAIGIEGVSSQVATHEDLGKYATTLWVEGKGYATTSWVEEKKYATYEQAEELADDVFNDLSDAITGLATDIGNNANEIEAIKDTLDSIIIPDLSQYVKDGSTIQSLGMTTLQVGNYSLTSDANGFVINPGELKVNGKITAIGIEGVSSQVATHEDLGKYLTISSAESTYIKNNSNIELGTNSITGNGGANIVDSVGQWVILGSGVAAKGWPTYVDGNEIYLRYGTSHTTAIHVRNNGNVDIYGSIGNDGSIFCNYGVFSYTSGDGLYMTDYNINAHNKGTYTRQLLKFDPSSGKVNLVNGFETNVTSYIGNADNTDYKALLFRRAGKGFRITMTNDRGYIAFGSLNAAKDELTTLNSIVTIGIDGLKYSPNDVNYYDILTSNSLKIGEYAFQDRTENRLSSTTDLNNVSYGVWGTLDNTTYENAPTKNFGLIVSRLNQIYKGQLLLPYYHGDIYYRAQGYEAGAIKWSPWRKILTDAGGTINGSLTVTNTITIGSETAATRNWVEGKGYATYEEAESLADDVFESLSDAITGLATDIGNNANEIDALKDTLDSITIPDLSQYVKDNSTITALAMNKLQIGAYTLISDSKGLLVEQGELKVNGKITAIGIEGVSSQVVTYEDLGKYLSKTSAEETYQKMRINFVLGGNIIKGNGDVDIVNSVGNWVILGNGVAAAGWPTYVDGNEIYMRYGKSHTTAIHVKNNGNIDMYGSIGVTGSIFCSQNLMSWTSSETGGLYLSENAICRHLKGSYTHNLIDFDTNQHVGIRTSPTLESILTVGGNTTINGYTYIGSSTNTAYLPLVLRRSEHGLSFNNTADSGYIVFGALQTNGESVKAEKVLRIGDNGLQYSSNGGTSYYDIITSNGGTISNVLTINNSSGKSIIIEGNTMTSYGAENNWYVDPSSNAYFYTTTSRYFYGTLNNSSDEKLKNILGNVELTIPQIANAPAITFTWKNNIDNDRHVGTIAQYWKNILPEVVHGEEGNLSMNYVEVALISSILLARNAEIQQAQIERIQTEIKKLQSELDKLKTTY